MFELNVLEDINVYWYEALASEYFGSVSFEYHTWAEVQNFSTGQLIMADVLFNPTVMWTNDIIGAWFHHYCLLVRPRRQSDEPFFYCFYL